MNILDVFTYNQHFVAMMNVINMARLNPPVKGHKHHIVPRCWFKLKELKVDNSDNNLVLLTYEDHCKVHKLMTLCAKDEIMRSKLVWALKRLTFGTFSGCQHTDESKRKISDTKKGKRITITDEDRERRSRQMRAMNASKNYYGVNNTFYGKHHNDKSKERMSNAKKGRHWRIVNGKREWYD